MKNTVKSIAISMVTIVASITTQAQQQFARYVNPLLDDSCNIEISIAKEGYEGYKFKLWIDAAPMDELHHPGGIALEDKHYQSFIKAMGAAKKKYKKWVAVAKANNVTEFYKDMAVKDSIGGYFKYADEWQFDYSVNLEFAFQVIKNEDKTDYLLLVRTGRMKAFDNENMTTDGYMLIFQSVEKIDTFLDKISQPKIDAFLNRPKKEELFK